MTPTCPRCGHLIQPDDSDDGLTFHCSECSAVLRLKAPLPGFVKRDPVDDQELNLIEETIDDATTETSDGTIDEVSSDDTPVAGILLESDSELEREDELGSIDFADSEESLDFSMDDELDLEVEDGSSIELAPIIPDEPETAPHVVVPDEPPETIEFSSAAEELRDSAERLTDESAARSEDSLHDEVSDLLDKAAGVAAAGAATVVGGMAIVGGSEDEEDDEPLSLDELDELDEDLEDGTELDEPSVEESESRDDDLSIVEKTDELHLAQQVLGQTPVSDEELTLSTEPEFDTPDDSTSDAIQPPVEELEPEPTATASISDEPLSLDNSEDEISFGEGLEVDAEPAAANDAPENVDFDFEIPDEDVLDDSPVRPVVEDAEEPLSFGLDDEPLVAKEQEPSEIVFDEFPQEEIVDDVETEPAPSFEHPHQVPTEEAAAFEEPPVVENAEFEIEDDSLLDDVGAGLGAAAAGAAALGAAASASGSDEEEKAPDIVFDRPSDEVVEELGIEFEDAARPQFNPDKIEVGDLELAPVDAAVANLPPSGSAVEGRVTQPFELATPESPMTVAPTVPGRRNILVDLIKLAVGSVVGLAIAQAILWWGLKIDPLGLAAMMPAVLTAAVPEELRNGLSAPVRRTPPTDRAVDDTPEVIPAEAMPAPGDLDERTLENASEMARDSEFGGSDSMEAADSDLDFDTEEAATDVVSDGSTTKMAVPFANYGLTNVESVSPYDLGGALAAAKSSAADVDAVYDGGGSPAEILKTARAFYTSVADLADKSTLVTRGGDTESVLAEVREFLDSVAGNRNLGRFLGKGALSWMKNDMGRGVALAGVVKSNDHLGDLREIQVQLDGTEATVTVVTTNNESLSIGSKAIILGVLVNDPSTNLRGYSGLDDKVIWSTDVTSSH